MVRLLVACCVAVTATPAAMADGFNGADKARAAGITVDPGAEKMMERAPAGSCFSDPTQVKCPKAQRVSTAAIPQCFVKSDPPFYAAGLAQGLGKHMCTVAVTRQELYVTLSDYISTGWRTLNTRSAKGVGGQTLRAEPKFNCDHSSARRYQTKAEGYGLLEGIWYAATQSDEATFPCPS